MADPSRPREDEAQSSGDSSPDYTPVVSPSYVVVSQANNRQPRRSILPAILRRGFWSRFFGIIRATESADSGSDLDSDSDSEDQYEDAVDTLQNHESASEPNNLRDDHRSGYSSSSDGSSGEYNPPAWNYSQSFQSTTNRESISLATRLFNVDPPERLLSGETWQVVEGRAHLPHGYQNGDGSTNNRGTYRRMRDGIMNVGGRAEGVGRRIAGNLSWSTLSGLSDGLRRGNERRRRPGDSARRVERRRYQDEDSSEGGSPH